MECAKCLNKIDSDSLYCDHCGAVVGEPAKAEAEAELSFVEIWQPSNQQELILLKMIFDRESINYYVNNELGSRLMGAGSFFTPMGAGAMRVFVQSDQAEDARKILREELGFKL